MDIPFKKKQCQENIIIKKNSMIQHDTTHFLESFEKACIIKNACGSIHLQ
jgi:hypothetical protein